MNRDKFKEIYNRLSTNRGLMPSSLKKREPTAYEWLYDETSFLLGDNITFKERCYSILYDVYQQQKCKHCGKITRLSKDLKHNIEIGRVNTRFCSNRCRVHHTKSYIKGGEASKEYLANPNNVKLRYEKTKETNNERYGVDNTFQYEPFKDKSKQTLLSRYGVDHAMKNEDIINKQRETMTKNNGYPFALQNPIINEQAKVKKWETWNELYGGHPTKTDEVKDKILNTLLDNYGVTNPYFVHGGSVSKGEIELGDYIESIGYEIIRSYKKTCNLGRFTLELDIFIPSLNIGFEYNGLYWHSDKVNTNTNIHKDKNDYFNSKRIEVIHIWEDEWKYDNENTKTFIKNRLNPIKPNKYSLSYDDNKVMMYYDGGYSELIVADSIITNHDIIGFGIMLDYYIDLYKPKHLTIELDLCRYSRLDNHLLSYGFNEVGYIEPRYKLLKGNKRVVCDGSDLPRIYDCGYVVYRLDL